MKVKATLLYSVLSSLVYSIINVGKLLKNKFYKFYKNKVDRKFVFAEM